MTKPQDIDLKELEADDCDVGIMNIIQNIKLNNSSPTS